MGLFKRQADDTAYGSKKRRKKFLDDQGVKKGVTEPSHLRRVNRQFDKQEGRRARRAKRRNGGSLF